MPHSQITFCHRHVCTHRSQYGLSSEAPMGARGAQPPSSLVTSTPAPRARTLTSGVSAIFCLLLSPFASHPSFPPSCLPFGLCFSISIYLFRIWLQHLHNFCRGCSQEHKIHTRSCLPARTESAAPCRPLRLARQTGQKGQSPIPPPLLWDPLRETPRSRLASCGCISLSPSGRGPCFA